ncbi:MAG: hypothetical protein JNM11_14235 [Chitinimonas sp.]|nr:hypothetical protein [Chitinimonas sp.]
MITRGLTLACAGLLLSAPLTALADGGCVPHPSLRLMMTGGITAGGDTIYVANYDNGSNSSIRAGDKVNLGVGAYWRRENSPWSLQLTANYHTDNVAAANGRVDFKRYPIEFLGHYHFENNLYVGGGLRYAAKSKFTLERNGSFSRVDVDSKPGLVAELGWEPVADLLLTLRYVAEEYEIDGVKFDGNHVGVTGAVLF